MGSLNDTDQIDLGDDNRDVLFDVLPSFEMHRSIYDSRVSRPSRDQPPVYGDELATAATPATSANSEFELPNTITDDPEPAPYTSTVHTSSLTSDTLQSIGLDDPANIHRLRHFPPIPSLKVSIHFTKEPPAQFKEPIPESFLREYTSGDVLHGYVIVQNSSPNEIPFHMFYLTLSGMVSVTDQKSKKLHNRRFLHMIDMNASWTYGFITPSANIAYSFDKKDTDGAWMALPTDRVMKPNTAYKKFFSFKFPHRLLDNACAHGVEAHMMLPPSLGVNRFHKNGKYAKLDVNPDLGYGTTAERGSPLLLNDLSGHDVSISYVVNATFIGLDSNEKDSNGDDVSKIIAEDEHYIRFVPFGYNVPKTTTSFELSTLEKLIKCTIASAERRLLLGNDGSDEQIARLDNEIKQQQLHLRDEMTSSKVLTDSYGPSERSSFEVTGFLTSVGRAKFGSRDRKYDGVIKARARIPISGLPYTTIQQLQVKPHKHSPHPILSSYSKEERSSLSTLDLDLTFRPSDLSSLGQGSKAAKPPPIVSVNSSLVISNVISKHPIPISLPTNILMDQDAKSFQKMKQNFLELHQALSTTKEKLTTDDINPAEYIPQSLLNDSKVLSDLKMTTSIRPHVKVDINPATSDWNESPSTKEWTKKLTLDLHLAKSVKETLVPSFQTCLMTRFYAIELTIKFKGCSDKLIIRVPIRVRNIHE